jgi:protocatechuate 3,4-dioxygenase beta subunit
MTSLSRLLCFALITSSVVMVSARGDTVAQTPDAKSKGTGSISGKVTLGGKAAAGIAVAAFGNDPNSRRAPAKATTDGEGHFRLFGLAAASYQIVPLTPSFVPAERNLAAGYPYYGAAKTILLSAGESVEDVDLKLVRGAVITGRITEEEGKPVIEERVELQPADEKPGQGGQMSPISMNYQMFQTDDRGIYRLYGLPAGRYKVSVGTNPNSGFSSNGARGYFPQTFYPDTTDATKAAIVEVGEGDEATNIDIRLGHRATTFSIAGRVVDSETGEPVAGIRPTYGRVAKDNPSSGSYMGGMPTSSRGEFRFDGLEPGHYAVFASSRFDGGDYYSDSIIFDVVDHDVTNLEIRAIRGLTLSGVVLPDSDTNKNALAQLGSLRIVAGVRTASNSPASSTSGTSLVAPDGSFRIGGLRPGKALLYVSSVEYANARRFSLSRVERDGVDQTQGVELSSGQSVSNVQVFISYGTGVIRGMVKFENGSPPAEARFFVALLRNGRSVDRGAQGDARGRFLITDIPPGNYEVVLNVGFYTPSPQPPPRPRAPLKQFVTVADDTEVEVTFTVDLKPKEGGP